MTSPRYQVTATGWSLYLPGTHPRAALTAHLGPPRGAWADTDAPPAERAAEVLGRKGMRYKEPATLMALCAVHRALGFEAGHRPRDPIDPRTAVVACSNLGNAETVSRVAYAAATEGTRAVSVLDAPNVSSNVIASTVALWFGFGGPNLMVCSGTTSSHDGLRLAALMLRSRRADRVVLVGAEPDDDVATALYAAGGSREPLRAGAACLIIEPPTAPGRATIELLPGYASWLPPPTVTIGPGGFDPAAHWGDHYGAQGIVELALAAHLAADEGHPAVAVHCEGQDGPGVALVGPAPAGKTR